ncbi:MAG TPA: DUF5677 domain-containing protein [Candidatus Saccharimonadales bacterium]|nr:DUF5677 domain-containing protein [Candidatus Saccharimonadales bacterium]
MGDKSPATAEAAYLGWGAVSVNRAAEGYLWLRESGRVAASKLLVRPALEATFSAIAVIKKHGFLFRKAYSEWEEDKKMFVRDAGGEKEATKALEDLKRAFQQSSPGYPVECKRITVRDAADVAGFLENYESAYRIYCQFTHGAMRAVLGHLDDTTDTIDTPMVSWCVLQMLDHLQTDTPAQIPNLVPFRKRLIRPD